VIVGRLCKYFLAYEFDVNQRDYIGQTALHCAAGYGHKEVATLLLESGADVQQKDNEEPAALYCAAGGGNLYVVEILLRKGLIFRQSMRGVELRSNSRPQGDTPTWSELC
jgi:ankyrin repeat protein